MTLTRLTRLLGNTGLGRFVHDTLTLQVGQGLAMIVQAVTALVMLRILGPELLGVYALSLAMIAVVGLLDPSAAARVALVEVARALGADDRDRARDALSYFLRIGLLINAVIVAALLLGAPAAAQAVYGRSDAGAWARWLVVPQLVDVPWGMLLVAVQARRAMTALVALESARVVASSLLTVGFLVAGWGLLGLVLAQLIVSGASAVASVLVYARVAAADPRLPPWRPLLAGLASIALRPRFLLGVRTALDKNLAVLGAQLPVLMLGAVSPAAVGYYAAALRVVSFPQPLLSGVARNLETALPHRAGRDAASLARAFTLASLSSGAIWSLVTLAIGLAGPAILVRLAGAEYAPAVPVLYPLLLQSLAAGFGVGVGAMLRTLDRMEHSIGVHLVSLAVTTPIGYLLIEHFGAVGGAWFQGVRSALVTVAGVGLAATLARSAAPPGPAPSPVPLSIRRP